MLSALLPCSPAAKQHCPEKRLSTSTTIPCPPNKWSLDEDAQLSAAIRRYGPRSWKLIAELVPGRSHAQCLQRWAKVLKPGLKKGQWTNEEDVHLASLVQAGWKNWSVIAGEIAGRTSKQCRERWFHHLDPSINRSPYSEEEDTLILSMHASIGGRWAQIARSLDARTGEAVKIRFKTLDRHRRSGAGGRCPQVTRRRSFVLADENGNPVTASRSKRECQRTSKQQMERSKRPRSLPSPPVPLRSVPPPIATPAQEGSVSSMLDELLMPATNATRMGSAATATSDKALQEEEVKPAEKKADLKELDWLADMLLEVENETSLDFADMHWTGVDDEVSIDELLCLHDDEPAGPIAGGSDFRVVGQPLLTVGKDATATGGAEFELDGSTGDSLLI